MPHTRRLARLPATGKISVRLSTEQRDLLIEQPDTPRALGHLLHRAPVRDGKLSVRLSLSEIERLIVAAARAATPDKRSEKATATLLRYLEGLEDRFETTDAPE